MFWSTVRFTLLAEGHTVLCLSISETLIFCRNVLELVLVYITLKPIFPSTGIALAFAEEKCLWLLFFVVFFWLDGLFGCCFFVVVVVCLIFLFYLNLFNTFPTAMQLIEKIPQQLLICSAHLDWNPQANPFPHLYLLSPRYFLMHKKAHLLLYKGDKGKKDLLEHILHNINMCVDIHTVGCRTW